MASPSPSAEGRSWPKMELLHLWVGLPFFMVVVKGFLFPLPLLDFWWHLKMGEVIATTGSIPRTDLFSFTAAGKPFIVQNWLAELCYWETYRLGGFPLLVFLNAALLAAALVPVYLTCRDATRNRRLAALATFLGSFMFFGNMRPQVFSFLIFALFYWILEDFRFRRRNRLWVLPLLTILWVNLHGAFVIGLALIALYLATEVITHLLSVKPDRLSFPELRSLGIVLAVSVAATLVNPETYRIYDYIRVVVSDQASQQFVMEWQPPRINSLQGALLFHGPFFALVVVLLYSRRRPSLTDLALFLSFSMFAITSTRNTIWFAIITPALFARYIDALDLSIIRRLFRVKIFVAGEGKPRYGLNWLIAAIAAVVLILVSPWVRPTVYGASLLEVPTPTAAVDFIERNGLQGNIFHPQIFGDYLIWRLYPRQKSFIDGRVHLFGEAFVREYQLVFGDSDFDRRLEPFHIRYLLLSKNKEQADSLKLIEGARRDQRWKVLFEDDVSVLFEKQARDQVAAFD